MLMGNLKTAFDGICAEEALKASTMLYLQIELQKRNQARFRVLVRGFAVAFASIAIIVLSGVFSYNLYFTPSAYVDVDVNPSIELTLNRFDRVIDARAYNEDGEYILSELSLKYKNYREALLVLIDTIDKNGYIQSDGLVSVTLQTGDTGKEAELLDSIQTSVTDYLAGHHHGTQVDVFPVSNDTQSLAHESEISPAKYLAIQELIELDPTVTVESCRSHSIREIRQQAQEHLGNHHGNTGNYGEPVNNGEPNSDNNGNNGGESSATEDGVIRDSQQGKNHHMKNNGGGHE